MNSSKPKERSHHDEPRPRLGRGLAALLADTSAPPPETPAARAQLTVPVEFLRPNPRNPRRQFGPDELHDLSESIRAKGIIQPIVVRPIPNVAGSYEIVAGERRWRAAQAAQLTEVPVIVVEIDDREALALAIIENVQRADLNPLEEARGYERLAEEFGYSQTELSQVIGKSRSHVANTIRLLRLPESIARMLADGRLSAGHARALLSLPDAEEVARQIVEQGLTVRDVEQLGQENANESGGQQAGEANGGRRTRPPRSPDAKRIAEAFSAALGRTVLHRPKGDAGEILIRYDSAADLEALRQRLNVEL